MYTLTHLMHCVLVHVFLHFCGYRLVWQRWKKAPKTAHKYLSALKKFIKYMMTELDYEALPMDLLQKCLIRTEEFMRSLAGPIEIRENLLFGKYRIALQGA